jgi:hypothetical protein
VTPDNGREGLLVPRREESAQQPVVRVGPEPVEVFQEFAEGWLDHAISLTPILE